MIFHTRTYRKNPRRTPMGSCILVPMTPKYRLESASPPAASMTDFVDVENRSDKAIAQVTLVYTSMQNVAAQSLVMADSLAPGHGVKKSFAGDQVQIVSYSLTWQQDGFPDGTETEKKPGSNLVHATVSVYNDFQSISDLWMQLRKRRVG
jgi:hypothetical protein